MLIVNNLSVQFGKRILFDEVNVTFSPGNCYGIIGANGAGKSTFLNIISGLKEPNSGNISLEPDKRLSILEQNHNLHDEYQVLETVLMGNKDLFLAHEWVGKQNRYPNYNFETYIPTTGEYVEVDVSTPPNAFQLIHLFGDVTFLLNQKSTLNFMIGITNLFNTNYREYLNRLRYYADDTGRNITIQIKFNY